MQHQIVNVHPERAARAPDALTTAWVIGDAGDLLAAVDRGLAHLAIQPHYLAAHELTDALAHARRTPRLIVMIDDVERVAAQLAGSADTANIATLAVADITRIATGGYSTAAHELIVYPFHQSELETRIARAHRAARRADATDDTIVTGTLELNAATHQVRVDGAPINFTHIEYQLLKFFLTHPDRAFTREALLSEVWGYDYYGGARTVDVHVRRVRAKLGGAHALRLRTLRSVGYRWDGTPFSERNLEAP